MKNRWVGLLLGVLGAVTLVSPARAQRGGLAGVAVSRGSIGPVRGGALRGGLVRGRRGRQFFAGPGFAPYFYDEDWGPGSLEGPPPEVLAPVVPLTPPAPAPSPAQSVVLELQGDHWVRLTNYGTSYGQPQTPSGQVEPERALTARSVVPSGEPPAAPRPVQPAAPPTPLPRAVLVFRDGHNLEIGQYVIVGGTIFTRADYWTSGSWTRKVPVAELDVPATLKLNQERGTRFSLPSGPNDVMMRP